MKRTILAFGAMTISTATVFVVACGDDEKASATNGDGGVTVVPGEASVVTTYIDGGIAYIDGALIEYDAGPSACGADASSATPLGPGLWGCGGRVQWSESASLCRDACRTCTSIEWRILRAPQSVPTRDYWLADQLNRNLNEDCRASTTAVVACDPPTFAPNELTPMRVCIDGNSHTDPEGNACEIGGCGLDSLSNQHFGGCAGDDTAGALCCTDDTPSTSGCASGTDSDTFNGGMAGCAGKVTWPEGQNLCAQGYHLCSAKEWTAKANKAPTHNYWTKDNLRFTGGNGACKVSKTEGSQCAFPGYSQSPMRICGAGTSQDSDGNRCAAAACSLEIPGDSPFMGGCLANGQIAPDGGDPDAGYRTAGTMCCCDPGK